MFKSITPDRGKEFAKHALVSDQLNGTPFYFPDPHSPWQRETNENTNGLIREYLPKTKEMDSISEEAIGIFIQKLNTQSRKCLGWRTTYEEVLHLI